MKLFHHIDRWEMVTPFVTSKESTSHIDTLTVTLSENGHAGRGEALGVDYLGETALTMAAQLEKVRTDIEAGIDFDELSQLLPLGGTRNAVDCALWDLRAKQGGQRVWEMLGLRTDPVRTVYTLSLDSVEKMATEAARHRDFPVLKLKLDQERVAEKVRAIRSARPDATLLIDANCAWSVALLESVADVLQSCRIAVVEQPLATSADDELQALDYPVTLCADESCQGLSDLESVDGRYQMVNIKLDKCGGLSEALRMVKWCRRRDLEPMVGNMLGSSLAMAPAFLIAQFCCFVDLDGPLLQSEDRSTPIRYEGARMFAPEAALWG